MSNGDKKFQPTSPTPTIIFDKLGKIVDEYRQTKSDSKEVKSDVPKELPKTGFPTVSLSSKLSPSLQPLYPRLLPMAGDTPQIQQFLRQELLKTRQGRSQNRLDEYKHIFVSGANNFVAGQQSYQIAAIVGGTASDSRITNTVRLRRGRIHVSLTYIPTLTAPSPASAYPSYRLMILRDKIPLVLGTAPDLWLQDSDPPSGTVNVLTGAGNAKPNGFINACQNPINQHEFHIYESHLHCPKPSWFGVFYDAGVPTVSLGPKYHVIKHTFDIDFNQVKQNYATYTSTNPDSNAIWMMIESSAAANSAVEMFFEFVSDIEFEDVQD